MKLLAVSQRVDVIAGRDERRDALDQNLARWLLAAGCLPAPVPNALAGVSDHDLEDWLAHIHPAAIVLSGGNDLGEAPERDATERRLLDWAASRRLPVLAICRGMQMMGVHAGGTLVEVHGHVRTRHRLDGDYDGMSVNSFHRFALADAPPGFRVLAQAEDGTIEAIQHNTLPWLGWMWHPEREAAFAPELLSALRNLLA